MYGIKTCCALVVLGAATLLSPSIVWAGQVKLDVSMAQGTLLADKKQTTFLKVGLTGFEMKGELKRTPVNVAIVLDRSGSMSGVKLARAKEAACLAVRRLDSRDFVSVVTYDSTVHALVPARRLTDKASVCRKIEEITSGGSTALFAGVSKGAEEVRRYLDRNRVNRVILLSDGLANVGPETPGELGRLGASLAKEGISVSTLGLGLGYNEDLMMQLAGRSDGNHVFVEEADDLARVFDREFSDVLSVVAQEVSIAVHVADKVRPVRVLNTDAEINGQDVVVQLNQIYSEQEKYVLLEVEVPATHADKTLEIARVSVSYANMETHATDRLSGTARVQFDASEEVVEESTNVDVMTESVVQIGAIRNVLATELRDKGRVEEARRVLVENAEFLKREADKYESERLRERYGWNADMAEKLNDRDWGETRKLMRGYQYGDFNQQKR